MLVAESVSNNPKVDKQRKRGERQMSKSLRSMTKAEESKAIERRLREKRGGLGYLAAVDAKKKAR